MSTMFIALSLRRLMTRRSTVIPGVTSSEADRELADGAAAAGLAVTGVRTPTVSSASPPFAVGAAGAEGAPATGCACHFRTC